MAGEIVTRKGDEGEAFWFLGGLYEVLLSSEESGGEMTIMRMSVPADAAAPPHRHPGTEAIYVVSGELEVHIEGETVQAHPGSIFHFPAGTLEYVVSTQPTTFVATYVPGGIDEFFREVGQPALSRTIPPPADEAPDFEAIVHAGARHGLQIEA